MSTISVDNIRLLFEQIGSLGFFGRIFGWRRVLLQNGAARAEFQELAKRIPGITEKLSAQKEAINSLQQEIEHYKSDNMKISSELEIQKNFANTHIENITQKEREIAALKEGDRQNNARITEQEGKISRIEATIEHLQKEIRNKETDLATLQETNTQNENKISELKQEISKYKSDIEYNIREQKEKENEVGSLNESVEGKTRRIQQLETDLALLDAEMNDIRQQNNQKDQEIAKFEKAEQMSHDEYDRRITELNALREQLNQDRLLEQKVREEAIEEEYKRMRTLWKEHEKRVEQVIKAISHKNGLAYIEKEQLPFNKKPDNALWICNEYVIFDAKSPGNSDLSNFPVYVKSQAEQAKKYLLPDVHKTIFLVVPTNTIDQIEQIHYDMADYQVYVITLDALEPVIQSLIRIESYEFAEQLDPEDRENICRVLGKFAHATKRRLQVDNYFCNEFLSILDSCRNLPEEIVLKTMEYEKADKMNPPIEKRKKEIRLDLLKKEGKRLQHGCEGQDIDIDSVSGMIDKIPLDRDETFIDREPEQENQ